MTRGTAIAEPSRSVLTDALPLSRTRNAGPDDNHCPPSLAARLIVFPLLFIPWLILYEWVVYRGPARGSFETYMPGEWRWPIWQWTELLYVSPYLLVTLVPFVATTRRVLRQFM